MANGPSSDPLTIVVLSLVENRLETGAEGAWTDLEDDPATTVAFPFV